MAQLQVFHAPRLRKHLQWVLLLRSDAKRLKMLLRAVHVLWIHPLRSVHELQHKTAYTLLCTVQVS